MPTDYTFFEQSLTQSRTYHIKSGRHCARFHSRESYGWNMGKMDVSGYGEILSGDPENSDECVIRGSHVMRSGNPGGVSAINKQFNIALPEQVDDFYRKWDGGFLFFQEFYDVLSVDRIIDDGLEWAEIQDRPTDLPWHFIRFCELYDGDYLALRRNALDQWDVVFADPSLHDVEFLTDYKKTQWTVVDSDFKSWLQRICHTDGWPLDKAGFILGQDAKPPAVRIK